MDIRSSFTVSLVPWWLTKLNAPLVPAPIVGLTCETMLKPLPIELIEQIIFEAIWEPLIHAIDPDDPFETLFPVNEMWSYKKRRRLARQDENRRRLLLMLVCKNWLFIVSSTLQIASDWGETTRIVESETLPPKVYKVDFTATKPKCGYQALLRQTHSRSICYLRFFQKLNKNAIATLSLASSLPNIRYLQVSVSVDPQITLPLIQQLFPYLIGLSIPELSYSSYPREWAMPNLETLAVSFDPYDHFWERPVQWSLPCLRHLHLSLFQHIHNDGNIQGDLGILLEALGPQLQTLKLHATLPSVSPIRVQTLTFRSQWWAHLAQLHTISFNHEIAVATPVFCPSLKTVCFSFPNDQVTLPSVTVRWIKSKLFQGRLTVRVKEAWEAIQNRETNLEPAVCHELVHWAIDLIKFGVRVEGYDGRALTMHDMWHMTNLV